MVRGLIGQKLGMTRVFDDAGNHVSVTVLRAGPCVVLQVKDNDVDGYRAAQVGFIEEGVKESRLNRPTRGHLDKAGAPPVRVIREFALDDGDDVEAGARVTVSEVFTEVAKVDVTGKSKGKGFQGVMRRHGFSGGKASHGSMFHRKPGSIGQAAWPSKVFKGIKLPGQMGSKRVTTEGLEVVKVDPERHLLVVKGSVPGAVNSYVSIRPAVRG